MRADFNQRPRSTPPPISGFTLVEIVVIVAVVGLLAAIAIPHFARARSKATRDICIYHLHKIEEAKSSWALNEKKGPDDAPELTDLEPFFSHDKFPACPLGGTYVIGSISERPTCPFSTEGHLLGEEEASGGSGGGD